MGDMLSTEKQASRAYGDHLADCFGLPKPPTYVHRVLKRGILAVSELNFPDAPSEPSDCLGYDDAYQVVVQLRELRQEFWLNGRGFSSDPVEAGKTYIVDLRQDPRVLARDAPHTAHFYMPISTLKAYAEQNGLPAFADMEHSPVCGHDDHVMRHLTRAALAALASPHTTTGLLLDTILNAVCSNVVGQYGILKNNARVRSYGLAPWQERRAKELMDERLDVSISELAAQCGISSAHFGRAFKRSTGIAPHQWQLGRRMKRAQALLTGSSLPIAEIALKCGFSSQSHFATAFKENIGASPGRWRQLDLAGQSSKIDSDT